MDASVVRAVEIFAAINFIAIGLSHALQPQAWRDFFALLHSKGAPGNFLNAFLSLGIGSMIAAFHNVWSGVPIVLTLYGWGSVAKGTLYLANPALGLRSIETAIRKPKAMFRVAGVVLLLLAVVPIKSVTV